MNPRLAVVSITAILTAVAFQAGSRPLHAQELSGPFVYVTTFDGNLYKVDTASHVKTLIFSSEGAPFEDAGVGPDGKVYVCVSLRDYIFRVDPNGFNYEVAYQKVSESDPAGPEGISFNSKGDAYFNTRNNDGETSTATGLWKLPGLGSVPTGGTMPAPVQVVTTFSTFGEGTTTRTADGSILFVDSTGGRVLRTPANPPVLPDPSPTTVISGLSTPVGVGTSNTGEILVSSEGSGDVRAYTPDGESFTTLCNIPEALYLDTDSAGNVYVVRFEDNPDSNAGGLFLCAGEGTTKIADIFKAVGVAMGPSSVSQTQHFSPTTPTQTYDYGVAKVDIRFNNVLTDFDLTLTRNQANPAGVNADLAANFPSAECLHDTKDGGACNFIEAGPFIPEQGIHFSGNFHVTWAFNTQDAIETYGMNHDSHDVAGPEFTTDIARFFSLVGGPGDPIGDGVTDNFQRFVQTNTRFDHLHYPCQIEPVTAGTDSFLLGSVVRVRFRLTNNPGCTGGFVPDAVPILTIVRGEDDNAELMPVRSAVNRRNFFNYNGTTNRYVYQLRTDVGGYTAGRYCATVMFTQQGEGAVPFKTCFTLTP
jgi:hypothetical protein